MALFTFNLLIRADFCRTTTNYHRRSPSIEQSESSDIRSEELENRNEDGANSAEM